MRNDPRHSTPVEGEEKIMSDYDDLVKAIVYRKFLRMPMEREDVIQIGRMGLMKAIRTFDPEKSQWGTWATFKICGEIWHALRTMNAKGRRCPYLIEHIDENADVQREVTQVADPSQDVEAEAILADQFERAMSAVCQRDQDIVLLRLQGKTQTEIGEELGVSQMEVWRTLQRMFGGMREHPARRTQSAQERL